MTKQKPTRETLALEVFLARLPEVAASEARAAAGRIDAMERSVVHLRGLEDRYLRWLAGSGLAFLAGLAVAVTRGLGLAGGYVMPGLIVAALGALPTVLALYAFRVLPRTRIDGKVETINRAYFLTHGGYYFAPGRPDEDGRVVTVGDWQPDPRRPSKYDHLKPGQIW